MAPTQELLCHVNLAPGFRGGERQTELLIAEFAGRGWRQRLVARRGGPLASRCRDIEGLDVVESASQPLAAAWVARGSGLLHAHEARAIYACWLAGRLSASPWLLTRRVDNPFKRSPLRDRAYRAAGRLVAVSTAIRRQIETRYPASRCDVVADAHAHLSPGGGIPPEVSARLAGRTVIGHVGALDHGHKGQGTIIDAARMAARERPELVFVLVGDGPDDARFRAAAAELDNVVFAGFVNDVGAWLDVFDLFVFPSLHEGLGSTVLDAMSFGLPVVATRVGGIPDIVADGVNGLLVEPERPAELLAALTRLLADTDLSAAMRAANRATANNYSPAAMADRYESIYRELLGDQRAPP